jgi:hypothetical protein
MYVGTSLARPLIVGLAVVTSISAWQLIDRVAPSTRVDITLARAQEVAAAGEVRLLALIVALALLAATCLVIARRASRSNPSPAADVFTRLHINNDQTPARTEFTSSR